jgi:hypothetical protein
MNNLDKLIDQLEQNILYSGTLNKEISQSDVAWHIEHSLLTIRGIADALIKSHPREYKWSFNFIRMVVMTTKKIPRGRAKAPKVVQPKGDLTPAGLQKHISETRNKIKALEGLSKDKYFEHPFFGNLKLGQALSVLEIHTKHHLGIIEDIKRDKDKG